METDDPHRFRQNFYDRSFATAEEAEDAWQAIHSRVQQLVAALHIIDDYTKTEEYHIGGTLLTFSTNTFKLQTLDRTFSTDSYILPPPLAPVLQSAEVNGTFPVAPGGQCVSRALSIELTYDKPIASVAQGAFSMTNTWGSGGGETISSDAGGAIAHSINGAVVTITFVGTTGTPGVNWSSLADGTWTLTINRAKITSADGGVGTNLQTITYVRRLFGDADNDRDVDADDHIVFSNALYSVVGSEYYNQGLDFNGDGIIDSIDENEFLLRYSMSLDA
jgi:hypothetical protein